MRNSSGGPKQQSRWGAPVVWGKGTRFAIGRNLTVWAMHLGDHGVLKQSLLPEYDGRGRGSAA